MDNRLKRKCDINEVFLKGKRVYSKSVTLIYLEKAELKVGISVSKKHGNAIERNHVKRLLRAVYFPILKQLKNYYIVFLPKTGQIHSFEQFFKDVNYLLKKEKLINEKGIN